MRTTFVAALAALLLLAIAPTHAQEEASKEPGSGVRAVIELNRLVNEPLEILAGGQVFALFIIAVAAAEVGIGLAIVLLIFRNRRSANVDELDLMKL